MTFIFDENLPKSVVEALSILQKRQNKRIGSSHNVLHMSNTFGTGTKDPDFLKNFPSDGVLITMDIGQQRKWQEKILIEKRKVSVIYYRSKKNLNYWQLALLFINSWQDVLYEVKTQKLPVFNIYRPKDVGKYIRNYSGSGNHR